MRKILPRTGDGGPARTSPRKRHAVYVLTAVLALGLLGFAAWAALPHAAGETTDARSGPDTPPSAQPNVAGPEEALPSEETAEPAETSAPSKPDAGGPAEAPEGTSVPGLPELPEPVREALLNFIDTSSALRIEPNDDGEVAAPDYSGIAEGSALGELTGQFTEYQDNGWIQSGPAEVLSVQAVEDLEVDGSTVRRLSICIDSSAMELKDQDGQVLLAAVEPGTRKSLNYYDLRERDGAWKVVSHSFPDDPAC